MPVRVKSAGAQPFGLVQPPPGWLQKPAGISLCMIVRDEEAFLERCLASVRGAVDEIVVVDTGSTDRTVDIAREFGARIEHREWRNDFAWARNEAIALARYRWILQLDADEELLEESKSALRQIGRARSYLTGVWVRCINHADQYLGGENTISHAVVRVFPNHERIRYHGTIHEFPSLDGATTTLPAASAPLKIVHHGYTSGMMRDRDKFERNLRIIEAAIEREPEEEFNWYNLGMTTYIGGDYPRAVQAMERMWEIAARVGARPFVPNGLTVLADALTDFMNDPEKALVYAREALKLSPRYANAHFSVGRALDALGRHDEAREMYLAAIADGEHVHRQFVVDEDVPRWKAQNMIGGGYAAQGDDASALQWFDEGLKSSPNVQPLRINRAAALERLGRLDEAEETFRSLCEDLQDEQSVLQYVNFLLRHKQTQALRAIERYYRACSNEVAVAQLLAAASVSQRLGVGDGESYLRLALEIAPGSAEVAGPLEVLYRSRGDEAAIAALRAAEAETEAKSAADFARRAQIAASEGDFARGLSIALAGLEKDPASPMLHYSAALSCAKLQRADEALAHLDALAEIPGDLQLHVLLLRASLCETLGRPEEAEFALRTAMPLGKRRVGAELGAFYLRAGRFADAQRVAEEALA
ncbi:MAG TPA: glycosyltransferase [Candidatus Baltobacteraceae bacterium]|nr:glycosyltransferase [Candidatus Baltobacteraceae bacterium]